MSDPDVAARARGAGQARASGRAGHLPHRDRVSRRRGPAGLGLAREGRHLHQHRPPGADRPQGARRRPARRGRICGSSSELGQRLGLDWNYTHPREVFAEMTQAMPSLDNITWERLEREDAVTYPCDAAGPARQRDRVRRRLPDRQSGRAQDRAGRPHPARRAARRRVPDGADHRPPARALAHRRDDARASSVLDALEPEAIAGLHPRELRAARRRARRPGAGRRRGAARSRSRRAPTTRRRRRAWCSSRSATPRPPPTC